MDKIFTKYPYLEMINNQQFREPGQKQKDISKQIIQELNDRYIDFDKSFEEAAYKKLHDDSDSEEDDYINMNEKFNIS